MNKIKRNGNQIFDENFLDGNILRIAEFSEELTRDSKKKFVTNHNFGIEMLGVYQEYRDNMNIGNICLMLEKLETIYHGYLSEMEENRRKG